MNNIGNNAFDIGYIDTLAWRDSPVHRLDPRAKLITTLLFIFTVASFDKYSVSALFAFFIYPIIMISLGGLPAGYLFKKVLLVSPFAILLGIFNPLMDKQVLVQVGPWVISGGWVSFASIILRFTLTVIAALILVSLTGFYAVCDALMKLKVPSVFVQQLLFFYRYLFVLVDEASRMARAQSLRSFHQGAMRLKTFIPLLGHLLLRTFNRAERIYCAMRCRGFNGRVYSLKSTGKLRVYDLIFMLFWAGVFIFMRMHNIPLRLGTLITNLFK